MPITPAGVTGIILPNLTAATLIGTGTPQLASGVGSGVSQWTPQIIVQTIDAGSLGVGSGGPLPVVIPPPSMLGAMTAAFASFGLLGVSAPLLITGLSNGLVQAYLQGLIKTTHPGIGVGAATATFRAPPAGPVMITGFKSAGMKGQATEQLALAVGQALDTVFASLVIPVPIVGSASPTGGSGTGVGNII